MYKVLLRIETEERISEGMYAKADWNVWLLSYRLSDKKISGWKDLTSQCYKEEFI